MRATAASMCLALGLAGAVLPLHARAAESDQVPRATVVVSGEVTQREERWDRRPNPLMGRPDWLKEIILRVKILNVIESARPVGALAVTVSIQRHEDLIAFKHLTEGWRGTFHLAGDRDPYSLVAFTDGVAPPPKPPVRPAPVGPTPVRKKVFPDDYGGREIRDSRLLQARAVREISRRYDMEEATVVFLVSHQGPMPPRGGYVYWGVKGMIRGQWHIWQPGAGRPRLGWKLIDPKQNQK